MATNPRVLEVDRFLTRELNIRNSDNSVPAANLSLHTDGQGGTYFRSVYNAKNPAGFNSIYLVNSDETINANLAYNTLKIKEGTGVAILKEPDNTIVIKAIAIIPSTFSYVNTPNGSIYAESITGTLNIVPTYGVTTKVSSNTLYLGGMPGFGSVNVSTIKNTFGTIAANSAVSSLTIVPDFGIDLQVRRPNVLVIGTSAKNYALNQVTINSQDAYNFNSKFNTLNFSARGNLSLQMNDINTIDIVSYSFSNIVTNSDSIAANITGPTLKFLTGYGLETTVVNSEIHLKSTKPAFDTIVTEKGTISTTTLSTSIVLNMGTGIDYDLLGNALSLRLASTFASAIHTETVSTIATNASILNFAAGESIVYSNSYISSSTSTSLSALKIDTNDFNEISIGGQRIFSNNPISNYKKKLKLKGLGNIIVQGDPLTNTVSFLMTGGLASTIGVSNAYSQVKIYSTIRNLDEDTTNFPDPFILNSAPDYQATLGITGVAPISVVPRYDFSKGSMFYIKVDKDNFFETPISSISVSHLNVLSPFHIPTLYANQADINSLNITSIKKDVRSSPLMQFDYVNNRIGINKNGTPALALIDISGTILAKTYATYSDPTLKSFKGKYEVTAEQLEGLIPQYFNWNEDNTHDVGFSANDVESVIPEAVKTGPTGLKMVDYSKLSIVSIASLHESNKRIKALESTLKAILEKTR